MKKDIPYYVSGHTASGFVNYIESNLIGINKVILLQHPVKQLISNVLYTMIDTLEEGEPCEKICSPYLAGEIEGFIFRNRSLAILTADLLPELAAESQYKTIDLTTWLPVEIDEVTINKAAKLQSDAYKHFARALKIHDDLERVYIDEMDFQKADKVASDLLGQMFHHVSKKNRHPKVYERLFGTNTIDGAVNEVEQLIEPMKHRVYVKGRAGTGKSVLLRKVLKKAESYGFDVELYRCSFDPYSIDMVLIRELNYCLFDSTDPHAFYPTRSTDQVVDLYKLTVRAGTDENYQDKITQITAAYKTEMQQGLASLRQLKQIQPFKRDHHVVDQNYTMIIKEIMESE